MFGLRCSGNKRPVKTNDKNCVISDAALAWAAERMHLSCDEIRNSLQAKDLAGLQFAYESWKKRNDT